jgi:hypothetical protein
MTWKDLLDLFVPPTYTLLGVMVWPVMLLAVAWIFRKQIAGLIDRIEKGKLWGAEFDTPLQTAGSGKKVSDDLKGLAGSDRIEPTIGGRLAKPEPTTPPTPASSNADQASSVVVKQIENIRQDPRLKDLGPEAMVEVLLRAQAAVQLMVTFERVYRLIFGSQLTALRMADRPGGVPIADIRKLFERFKAAFPEVHKNRTFEQWAQFLIDTGMGVPLPDAGSTPMAGVTDLGHEFLEYVRQMRYPDPFG